MIMKKKHLILMASAFLAAGVMVHFGVPKRVINSMVSHAGGVYTCDLPEDYVEIEAINTLATQIQDESSYIANEQQFRGTVTAVAGKYAYIQRRNQSNGYVDGLRIKNVDLYAPGLAVGNIIDIYGGLIRLERGTPTLELTGENQYTLAFEDNPTGYGPQVFQTFQDYLDNGFRGTNLLYDVNKLVTIRSFKVVSFDANYHNDSFFDGDSFIHFECSWPDEPTRLDTLDFYIDTNDASTDLELLDIVSDAYFNDYYIDVTGYVEFFDNYFIMHVARADDIALGTRAFDTNVFDAKNTCLTFFSLDSYDSNLSLYYPKGSDIPYVLFNEFINDRYFEDFGIRNYGNYYTLRSSPIDSDIVTYKSYNNLNTVVINTTNNSITISGENFLYIDMLNKNANGCSYLINGIETQFCQFNDELTTQYVPATKTVTFNLGSYGINFLRDSYNNAYIPLQTAIDIFYSSNGYSFGFNGKDLFFYNSLGSNFAGDTLERRYYYDSPFHNTATMGSAAYAQFAYNEFCFAIDHCYGLKEIRGVSSADSLIESLGLKSALMSNDPEIYENAMQEFAGRWLFDGHAGYTFRSPRSDYVSVAHNYGYYLSNYNDRYDQLYSTSQTLSEYREAARGGVITEEIDDVTYIVDDPAIGLHIYDDMAVITFDSFVKYYDSNGSGIDSDDIDLSSYNYYQLQKMGSDLLFKKAFNEIQANATPIKYVVIDISINGGGMVDSIPYLEAYLTLDPSLTNRNRLTGEVFDVHYKVDLNQDGTFDENDTFKDDYDFFLLTSNYSFSCGNLFPTYVKSKGLATIIGDRSGGGACTVGSFSTAHGATFRNSSNYQGGYWDTDHFVDNEAGIPVDYSFPLENYYNDSALRTFVESLVD